MTDRHHCVDVQPGGFVLSVCDGETVMAAAERLGYRWPTLCHGEATCSICWAQVLSGEQNLDAPGEAEQATLELLSPQLRAGRQVRLACQAASAAVSSARSAGSMSSAT